MSSNWDDPTETHMDIAEILQRLDWSGVSVVDRNQVAECVFRMMANRYTVDDYIGSGDYETTGMKPPQVVTATVNELHNHSPTSVDMGFIMSIVGCFATAAGVLYFLKNKSGGLFVVQSVRALGVVVVSKVTKGALSVRDCMVYQMTTSTGGTMQTSTGGTMQTSTGGTMQTVTDGFRTAFEKVRGTVLPDTAGVLFQKRVLTWIELAKSRDFVLEGAEQMFNDLRLRSQSIVDNGANLDDESFMSGFIASTERSFVTTDSTSPDTYEFYSRTGAALVAVLGINQLVTYTTESVNVLRKQQQQQRSSDNTRRRDPSVTRNDRPMSVVAIDPRVGQRMSSLQALVHYARTGGDPSICRQYSLRNSPTPYANLDAVLDDLDWSKITKTSREEAYQCIRQFEYFTPSAMKRTQTTLSPTLSTETVATSDKASSVLDSASSRIMADSPPAPDSGWAVFKGTIGNEVALYRAVFVDLWGDLWYATTDGIGIVVSCVRPGVETSGTAVYLAEVIVESWEFNTIATLALGSLVFTQFWAIPVVALGEFGSRKLWVVVKDGSAVAWDLSSQLPQSIYSKAADGTTWVIEKTQAVAKLTQSLAIGTIFVAGSIYILSETVKRQRIA
jgi:hypothetical protein